MKKYYSEFVAHCIRTYAKSPNQKDSNTSAVDSVFRELSEADKAILLELYEAHGSITDTVSRIAKRTGMEENRIWCMVTVVEKEIAKRRGLL